MSQPARAYAREQEEILAELERRGEVPRLLLHACCAPCSSAVLEKLSRYFRISILYYNPNIAPEEEYHRRRGELERLIAVLPLAHPVELLPGDYDGAAFREIARGLENAPEGGERCLRCFRLRLEEAARVASERGFDFFTTTLSISPLKDARALNEIGEEVGRLYGVRHLPADFKKKEGYKRSIELSREYDLYRQDYCGCVYSRAQREREKEERKEVHGHHI